MTLFSSDDPRIDHTSFASPATKPNTLFAYLYRDADNYKQAETVVFVGALQFDQVQRLLETLDNEDQFVPSAVGLEDLQQRMVDMWQPDVDHPYHEIQLIALTNRPATTQESITEFVQRFQNIDWEAAAQKVEESNRRLCADLSTSGGGNG